MTKSVPKNKKLCCLACENGSPGKIRWDFRALFQVQTWHHENQRAPARETRKNRDFSNEVKSPAIVSPTPWLCRLAELESSSWIC